MVMLGHSPGAYGDILTSFDAKLWPKVWSPGDFIGVQGYKNTSADKKIRD